jgi:hypothetical protein
LQRRLGGSFGGELAPHVSARTTKISGPREIFGTDFWQLSTTFLENNLSDIDGSRDTAMAKTKPQDRDRKARVKKEEKKMTGRELWEKGLVGKLEEEDDEEEDGVDIEKLRIAS